MCPNICERRIDDNVKLRNAGSVQIRNTCKKANFVNDSTMFCYSVKPVKGQCLRVSIWLNDKNTKPMLDLGQSLQVSGTNISGPQ